MNTEQIIERLQQRFGDAIVAGHGPAGDTWAATPVDALLDVCRYLRDEPDLGMDFLNCISGVDYCASADRKTGKVDWEPHLELVYHLMSLCYKHRLTLKVLLPRWKDDQEGELPEAPSVAGLWRTAEWHEREVFDLCGVRFTGHPDLRRILCPEDWVGYPLRKDYEMPQQYHNIRGQ